MSTSESVKQEIEILKVNLADAKKKYRALLKNEKAHGCKWIFGCNDIGHNQ